MTKIYVNWMDEEILSEKAMREMREEMLDLEEDSGKCNFEEFFNDEGYDAVEVLTKIITAEDKAEIINPLMEKYKKYVNDSFDNIYEKITLD